MSEELQYTIRDPSGAIYGPANAATLRQWIAEGRISRQMDIALQGTQNFIPAGQMPELAGAFAATAAPATTTPATAPSNVAGTSFPNTAATSSQQPYPYKPMSGLALASFICSLCTCFLGGIPGIVGIILGHLARAQMRREPDRYTGAGFATAGLVIGYSLVAIYALFIIVYVGFIIIAINSGAHPAPAPRILPPP